MNPYERDYFVSRIRSGFHMLKLDDFSVKVLTPTLEDEYLANEVFSEAFDQARKDDLMIEEEMLEWMISKGLWSSEKDEKVKTIEKDIEKLKIEIFNARSREAFREKVRLYIRAAEKALVRLMAEKNDNFPKTCEGMATQEKAVELFKRCCFVGGEPLDFNSVDINEVFYQYNGLSLTDKQVRELARNEPWRSLYILKDDVKLFANKEGRQLSMDQRAILIWSRMYDNVQESIDCPTDEVIEDDDMLDGWFIIQRKKHESDRAKSELEKRTQNSKISNSDEIYVFTDSRKEAESIDNMNSINAQMIKKQREQTIENKGGAVDLDFQDQKIKLSNMSNEQFKGKFRR
jgi:hypothetical protein